MVEETVADVNTLLLQVWRAGVSVPAMERGERGYIKVQGNRSERRGRDPGRPSTQPAKSRTQGSG